MYFANDANAVMAILSITRKGQSDKENRHEKVPGNAPRLCDDIRICSRMRTAESR